MKESLERQDSAALFFLLGQRDKAERQLREHRARFDAAFRKAANNITEQGEPEVIESIRRGREDYYRLYDSFLSEMGAPDAGAPKDARPRPAEEQRRGEYFDRLEPQFNRLRADCDRLLQLNQHAMLMKSEAAGV